MSIRSLALAVLAAGLPVTSLATGGHDSIGCTGCHSIHSAKGDLIFAIQPNKVALNPKTKQPYTGTTALCLGCHEETSKGGQGYAPVSAHISHPFGLTSVNPKIAKVPPELLREGGRFECLGCHDPHPSNPNYKYLRVDTQKGSKIDAFCGVCHPGKAEASEKVVLFTSMDESSDRVMKPAASAPSKASAPAKAPAAPSEKKKR